MKVGAAIYDILANDATVAALVVARIYPLDMPQLEVYPAVVYSTVSNNPSDTKDGQSLLDVVRVQVDSYAETYAEAVDLGHACRNALEVYSGTSGGVVVNSINFLTAAEIYNTDIKVYQLTTDYNVRITNPVL